MFLLLNKKKLRNFSVTFEMSIFLVPGDNTLKNNMGYNVKETNFGILLHLILNGRRVIIT